MRACGCGGNTVLAGTRLGDDSLFAHADGQQRLPQRVVDFVGTGMIEVLAFEPDLCPSTLRGQIPREIQRRRAADKIGQQALQLSGKRFIALCRVIFPIELIECSNQCLRDEPSAE